MNLSIIVFNMVAIIGFLAVILLFVLCTLPNRIPPRGEVIQVMYPSVQVRSETHGMVALNAEALERQRQNQAGEQNQPC